MKTPLQAMTKTGWITAAVLLLLGVVPPLLMWMGNEFYLLLSTRLVILAVAAVSLNLILGYGGMASFGHAAFIGIGAYAMGIPVYHEFYGGAEAIASTNGWFQIGLAVGASALFALITGAISLRTKGVYFIMITMAFAQMVFYLFQSLDEYGGDDGLVIEMRSELPWINLDDPLQMYFLAFGTLLVTMLLVHLIVNSRFGMVLRGAKGNDERVVTLGYNTYLYRLTAYVIAGVIAGFAGWMMANFSSFISPSMTGWTRSGDLMFMVILGGTATALGPVLGAAAFVLIEEALSSVTVYWNLPFGLMLIGVVLFARGGLLGMLHGRRGDK